MDKNYKRLFQPWEISIAKKIVGKFYHQRSNELKGEGFDDLMQESLTLWFFKKEALDLNQKTLIHKKRLMAKIIRDKLTDIIKSKNRDKRKAEIEEYSPDKENLGLYKATIDEKNLFQEIALKNDLSNACQKLSPQQKELCSLIKEKNLNIRTVSKHLKIHHSTVYDEIKRIRILFQKEGLKEYLK